MNYNEYVQKMKDVPYAESLSYRLGYGGMISRGREWPQLVEGVDDSLSVVKVPMYHINNNRYVRVLGFTKEAFRGKALITDIIIGKVNNACIASGSFAGCKNLKRITIPRVVRIEENAFKDCDNLEDVFFEGSMEEWREIHIVSEKHEMHFGDYIPGTPVQKLESDRLIHLTGNDALLTSTVHFNCNLDDLIPEGDHIIIHNLMKETLGRMSVTMEELGDAKQHEIL